jgi:hypothetical protein
MNATNMAIFRRSLDLIGGDILLQVQRTSTVSSDHRERKIGHKMHLRPWQAQNVERMFEEQQDWDLETWADAWYDHEPRSLDSAPGLPTWMDLTLAQVLPGSGPETLPKVY